VDSENAAELPGAATVDMKLDVVVLPVSDVDRAKAFYAALGWREDADFVAGDGLRVVQLRRRGRRAPRGPPRCRGP
jgi:catechol 2,3-dioxygenase-like lactoylglutathione lyase family enzyme